jgi:hypothetical protein
MKKGEVLAVLGPDSSHEDIVNLIKRHAARSDEFDLDEVAQSLSRYVSPLICLYGVFIHALFTIRLQYRKDHDTIWSVSAARVEKIVTQGAYLSEETDAADNDEAEECPQGLDAIQFLHATTEFALMFIEVRNYEFNSYAGTD